MLPFRKAGLCRALPSQPLFFALLKQEAALCSLSAQNLPRALQREISQAAFSCSLFLLASGQHSPAGVIYQQIRRKRKEEKKNEQQEKIWWSIMWARPVYHFVVLNSLQSLILAHVVQTRRGPSLHLRSSPCAGYCCEAGRAAHAMQGVFVWKAAASWWLHRRDGNTGFVAVEFGFSVVLLQAEVWLGVLRTWQE